MSRYALAHLSDSDLLRDLKTLVARDRATTAELLAHLAEVDERKLYLPAAYPSMYAYCVGALGLSEDSAAKRIQVARAARRFPVLFEALAAGRLHLSGVVLLAPHLTPENAVELLTAAAHRTKAGIELLLAARFPRPDLATRLVPQAQDILRKKASFLKANGMVKVTIEGHCDDRGTNEYNLALGEARARSAKAFLVDLGIPAARMATISYGEERPAARGSSEDAWDKNRRAHFVIEQ